MVQDGVDDDAARLSELLTVIVTTSPCPSHPSTRLLEEVLASAATFAPSLRLCRVLIAADGFKIKDQSHWKQGRATEAVAAAYLRYLARLRSRCGAPGSLLERATICALAERHGCAHALRRCLSLARTPYVLVLQHDRPFVAAADVAGAVLAMEAAGDVNHVAFATSCTIDYARRKEARYAPLRGQMGPRVLAGRELVPMVPILDSSHVARVAWLQEFVFGRGRLVNIPRGGFVEDTLGPAQLALTLREGLSAAHGAFGTWLLPAAAAVVGHLNGHDAMAARGNWGKWAQAARHTSEEEWERLEAQAEGREGAGDGHEGNGRGGFLVLEGFGEGDTTGRRSRRAAGAAEARRRECAGRACGIGDGADEPGGGGRGPPRAGSGDSEEQATSLCSS